MSEPRIDEVLEQSIPARTRSTDWLAGTRRKRDRRRAGVAAAAVVGVVALAVPLVLSLSQDARVATPTVAATQAVTTPSTKPVVDQNLAACAAQLGGLTGAPDLAEGSIISSTSRGDVTDVVIEMNGHTYGCLLAPGLQPPTRLPRVDVGSWLADPMGYQVNFDVARAVDAGATRTLVSVDGHLPVDAATIDIAAPVNATVRVVDGSYHDVVPLEGDILVQPTLRYVVRDAAGSVLYDSLEAEVISDQELLKRCTAAVPDADNGTPDLAAATVVSRASVGPQSFALLYLDGMQYDCALTGSNGRASSASSMPGNATDWDPYTGYRVLALGHVEGATLDIWGGGTLPADARQIRWSGAVSATTPVGDGGIYTFFLTGGSAEPLAYDVLAADGAVLYSGVAHGEGEPLNEGNR